MLDRETTARETQNREIEMYSVSRVENDLILIRSNPFPSSFFFSLRANASKKRGISSPTVKWNNDNCQKFQEILITRSDDRHLFETCRRNIWNIAVRFGIDPRETCVRCSISSPGHPLHTHVGRNRGRKRSRAPTLG